MTITGKQVQDARNLIGWSQSMLAREAAVSLPTVQRIEDDQASRANYMRRAVIAALESAGVEFIAENGGGAGVRLRKAALAVPVEKLDANDDK